MTTKTKPFRHYLVNEDARQFDAVSFAISFDSPTGKDMLLQYRLEQVNDYLDMITNDLNNNRLSLSTKSYVEGKRDGLKIALEILSKR